MGSSTDPGPGTTKTKCCSGCSEGPGPVMLRLTVLCVRWNIWALCSKREAPRARDFPNPHDGEMKKDPVEKLYETPTKKTMILMKWVDWEFSEIQSITLSYNKNN